MYYSTIELLVMEQTHMCQMLSHVICYEAAFCVCAGLNELKFTHVPVKICVT